MDAILLGAEAGKYMKDEDNGKIGNFLLKKRADEWFGKKIHVWKDT